MSQGRVALRRSEIPLRSRDSVEAFSMKGASSSSILLDISSPLPNIDGINFNFANFGDASRDLTFCRASHGTTTPREVHDIGFVHDHDELKLIVDLLELTSLRARLIPGRNVVSDLHDPPNIPWSSCSVDQPGIMR